LLSCIRSAELVAYEDLKTEAVQRLVVENFPLLVTNDAAGRDLYEEQVAIYQKKLAI
jgi:fumarate hydratase subunit beta